MDAFLIVQGNDQGRRYALDASVIGIGRDPTNAICLHDSEASRFHAEISKGEAGRRLLVDLESRNGVYVNGERVRSWLLRNGDLIQIGSSLILFTSAAHEQPSCDHWTRSSGIDEFSFPCDERQFEITSGESIIWNENGVIDNEAPDWLVKARAHFNFLYEALIATSRTLDVDQLLNKIQDLTFQWAPIDRMCVLLYNACSDSLELRASRSRDDFKTVAPSRPIVNYAFFNKKGVLTRNAQDDERWDSSDSAELASVKEAVCVPMQGRYGQVGAIYIDVVVPDSNERERAPSCQESTDNPTEHHLTIDHLKLMMAIGRQAALAIEDTQYYLGMVHAERLAAIGQTVAVLSHHIKNILQGVKGGGYLIDSGLKNNDRALIERGWQLVEKNQMKISDLVLDMLAFSKERAPEMELNDLNDVLTEVAELMRGRAQEFNVDLLLFPDRTMPKFNFDSEQIHRAVVNLVANAIEASNDYKPSESTERASYPRGRVEIALRYDRDHRRARIIVDDTGKGAPAELKNGFFRPFQSKNKNGGTGLGLAITQKIAQEHKGKVIVEDSPLGGARFILEIPTPLDKVVDEDE